MKSVATTRLELSKVLFGSNHMLSIAVEIAKAAGGEFSVPMLSESTGLPPSTIHHALERLKSAGLVRRLRRDLDFVVVFERRESLFWAAVLEIEDLGPDAPW